MKVSINWIREYLNFDLPATNELVERIGAQLGQVEEVTDLGPKYAGAVIVRVVECSKLENSDHLNLCFIDDGGVTKNVNRREDGLVQVVCGAPNVAAGVRVVWLPPGATVPSTYDADPFVLEARELRGTISNGMLASPKELGIGDSHEGLLLLDGDHAPGTSFNEAYKLDDQIIEIENKMFTHRPDCFGQLGVAREIAGILHKPFTSPKWYATPGGLEAGSGLTLRVENEIPDVVPRFMVQAFSNVAIAPSPVWLQAYLSRVGVRPINNVVDITNYLMLLTGQPLHAYDYDKVAALSAGDGASLVVRYPQKEEQLELLSGKTITPRAEAIMIATDKQAIGLGGVMGGANTEVDETTKNIILECASFDMYSIRRTSMAHGLFTDAVTRFNKGQSSLQNASIFAQAVSSLAELAQATPATEVIDDRAEVESVPVITVDATYINARLGLQLAAAEMAQLLTNVELPVRVHDDTLQVTPAFWRTDLEIPEDIVEEVGRLYGFDALPLELPERDITPAEQDQLLQQKNRIRSSLVRAGANELLTYSFVHGKLLDKASQDKSQAFSLGNALSPDLQYYRLSVLPSLLDKVHANIKSGHDRFALFELGKGHAIDALNKEGLPVEFEDLDLIFASKQPLEGAPYYQARKYLDVLASNLGVTLRYEVFSGDPHDPVTDPYELSRSARVFIDGEDQPIGVVGELKASVRKQFKLPDYSAAFSINIRRLPAVATRDYQPLPRFPKVEQDICLRVPVAVNYAALTKVVTDTLQSVKPEHTVLSVSPLDIYRRENDSEHVQITYRVGIASHEKTMTDQEMAGILQKVTEAAARSCSAERI